MPIHAEGSRTVYLPQPAGFVGEKTPQQGAILFHGHRVIAYVVAQVEAGVS
jgi:hypothetical protein